MSFDLRSDARRTQTRTILLLGFAAFPILLAGVLSFDVRACLIGAAIAGCAAVAHAALALCVD